MSTASLHFVANSLPALEAGAYKLQVSQSIGPSISTGTYFNSPVEQVFHVDAPQFVMPAEVVGPRLPGPNGIGDFSWILPQVQLNRKTLPWERKMTNDPNVPWMALIVLRDSELTINGATQGPIFNATVGTIGNVPTNVFWPAIAADSLSEKADTPVQTIRIGKEVFAGVMPRLSDLAMLCHTRVLQPEPGNRQGEVNRTIAMVSANRFPPASATGRCHCFLVSVEGYANYLVDAPVFPSGKSLVQLAVLQYWSVVSQPVDMARFLSGLPARITDPSQLLLRVPLAATVTDKTVRARIGAGYVPVEYAVSGQSSSYAWYRGPLTAAVAQPLPEGVDQLLASDGAMIYIQNEGVFDQSYAAAWEIGRALALADTEFAMALLRFRTASYRILSLLIERLRLSSFANVTDLQAIVDSNAVYNSFDSMINQKITALLQRISLEAVVPNPNPLPTPVSPTPPVVETQNFLRNPAIVQWIGEAVAEELLPVAARLAEMRLLCRVPFTHLVPDQRMLPPNSVRFFYIDQGWLDCLVAGAKSVGVEGSQDTFFYEAMRYVIDDAVAQEMDAYMLNIAGVSTGDKTGNSTVREAMSGMLIRSSIVADYPSLTVTATKTNGTSLKILRKERLSDNVMFVIFLDVPDKVILAEPNAGLSMGTSEGKISLRTTSGSQRGGKTNTIFPSENNTFTMFFRNIDTGAHGSPRDNVLNLTQGTPNLVGSLGPAVGINPMDSADLALQLVLSPDFFTFNVLTNG
jgi:hypothetical protein